MKIESISTSELLKAYLNQNYPASDVLVIYHDSDCDTKEFVRLMRELEKCGHKVPEDILTFRHLIIEMPAALAQKITNTPEFDHGSIRLEVFQNGECIHENR